MPRELACLSEETRSSFSGAYCRAGEHQVLVAQYDESENVLGVGSDGEGRSEKGDIDGRRRTRIGRTPRTVDGGADAREQSFGEIWLRHIAVGATRDAANDGEWIVETGEQHHRQIAELWDPP